jgi:hypothetical protein
MTIDEFCINNVVEKISDYGNKSWENAGGLEQKELVITIHR